MKRVWALVLLLGLALAWGPKGHSLIAGYAVMDLPPDTAVASFFVEHREALLRAANDPDRRKSSLPGEAERHYWSSELFEPWPFSSFPMSEEAAKKRFGADTLERAGTLPWAIAESYWRLVEAFRDRDPDRILHFAGDLAHYLGDAHQPLHTTLDFDGQAWLNGGIHALFESTQIEAFWDEGDAPGPYRARLIDERPLALAFAVIREDYPLVTVLNRALWRAKRLYSELDRRYYRTLWQGIFGETARVQIGRASRRLADLYLSAWIRAGRPPLP